MICAGRATSSAAWAPLQALVIRASRSAFDLAQPPNRQLHGCAVTPVVALQEQGQARQGRDLSTLAPLRALRARTPVPAWARRAVGEGDAGADGEDEITRLALLGQE